MFRRQIILHDVIQKNGNIVLCCFEFDENFKRTTINVPYYGKASVESLSASKGLPIKFEKDKNEHVISIPLDLKH